MENDPMLAYANSMAVDATATRFYRAGDGVPVVLLHNGHTGMANEVHSARMWAPVFQQFASRFDTIALDRLGQGETDVPDSPEEYGHDASVKHTRAFLRELNSGPYHLIGHDEGGFIAAQIAVDAPEMVASLTLVAANSLTPGSDRRGIVLKNPPLPLLSRASLRWIFEESCHSHLGLPATWLNAAEEITALSSTQMALSVMADEERLLSQQTAQWTANRSRIHRHIHSEGMPCPTLIVWGLDDPIAPIENAKYLMELLAVQQRDTELRLLNAAGHYPHWEQSQTFLEAVTSFIDQVPELVAATRARSQPRKS